MSAPPALGVCTVAEWPALLAELDSTFVTERGRTGSLARRFPAALGSSHLANVRVAREGGQIVSCCAARRFLWLGAQRNWQGAMIGMVWTHLAHRGRGHAARVLEFTLRELTRDGVDFAVLWSSLPRYYENLGWQRHDRGVLGVIDVVSSAPAPAADTREPLTLEPARRLRQTPRVERNAAAWQALPLPAERLGLIRGDGPDAGYALFGTCGTTRYVYEVIGAPGEFERLWAGICAGATRVYVNECADSVFQRWLATHTGIRFTPQQLAHWWPLSPAGQSAPWRAWYLPWFDRI